MPEANEAAKGEDLQHEGAIAGAASPSALPAWVSVGRKLRWWSSSQQKFMVVLVTRVDEAKRLVIVTFEADKQVWKSVPFHMIGTRECPLQSMPEAKGSRDSTGGVASKDGKDDGHKKSTRERSRTPDCWALEKKRLLDTTKMRQKDEDRRKKEKEKEEQRRVELLAVEKRKVEEAFERRKKEAEAQRLKEEEAWRENLRRRREKEAAEEQVREREREERRRKRREEKGLPPLEEKSEAVELGGLAKREAEALRRARRAQEERDRKARLEAAAQNPALAWWGPAAIAAAAGVQTGLSVTRDAAGAAAAARLAAKNREKEPTAVVAKAARQLAQSQTQGQAQAEAEAQAQTDAHVQADSLAWEAPGGTVSWAQHDLGDAMLGGATGSSPGMWPDGCSGNGNAEGGGVAALAGWSDVSGAWAAGDEAGVTTGAGAWGGCEEVRLAGGSTANATRGYGIGAYGARRSAGEGGGDAGQNAAWAGPTWGLYSSGF